MALEKLDLTINYSGKNLSEVKELVEKIHYSKTTRSQQQVHVFKLLSGNKLVGAAIFGKPMSRHFNSDILELRRFILIDEMPRNSESYFLSRCIKWIKKNDKNIKQIVSFSDPNYGHLGIIYKATNFIFDGEEKAGNPRVLVYKNKKTHIRQVYQKRKGEYTKNALYYQSLIKNKEAIILKQDKKLRYIYNLQK